MNQPVVPIVDKLPAGYRWADELEVELGQYDLGVFVPDFTSEDPKDGTLDLAVKVN